MTTPNDADREAARLACSGNSLERIAQAIASAREAGEAKGRREALGEVTAGDEERARAMVAGFGFSVDHGQSARLARDFAAALASERAKERERIADIVLCSHGETLANLSARIRAGKP